MLLEDTNHCPPTLNVPHFPNGANYNAHSGVGCEMDYQGVIGRSDSTSWLPPMGPVGVERLVALAANTLAWMVIVKLIVER
jgi:hypothetical protein